MSVIIFQKDDSWLKSAWIFYRLIEDIRSRYALSQEEKYELDQDEGQKCIHFHLMKPALRNKLMRMMKETVTDILDDKTNKYIGTLDEKGYAMYKRTLPELLGYIKDYENAEWPPYQDS